MGSIDSYTSQAAYSLLMTAKREPTNIFEQTLRKDALQGVAETLSKYPTHQKGIDEISKAVSQLGVEGKLPEYVIKRAKELVSEISPIPKS